MTNKYDLTGVILAGGKSTRMGENKAFIKVEGIPIIRRIHSTFKSLFREIIVVTNQKELFENLDANIFVDLLPNRGALAGLYTGLYYSSLPFCFCVACDMPFLNKDVIAYLIRRLDDADVVIPKTHDGLQPLHAIYSKSCLQPVKKTLDQGKSKILDFYPMVRLKVIEEEEFLPLDPEKRSFININTPQELIAIENASPLR